MVIASACNALCENELSTCADHHVLLVNSQETSCLVGIIRIEEERQVLCNRGLVKGNALLDDTLVNRVKVKQVQCVRASLVTGDSQLVKAGSVGFSGKFYRIGDVSLLSPGVLGQPRVRQFIL